MRQDGRLLFALTKGIGRAPSSDRARRGELRSLADGPERSSKWSLIHDNDFTSRLHGADEICEKAIGRGDYAGLVLDDGKAKDIHIETNGGGGAFELRQGVAE